MGLRASLGSRVPFPDIRYLGDSQEPNNPHKLKGVDNDELYQ